MKYKKEYCRALGDVTTLGLIMVVEEARRIMRKYPRNQKFTLAMGSAFFTDKDGKPLYDVPKYAESLFDFIYENDGICKFTGTGICFTKDSVINADF